MCAYGSSHIHRVGIIDDDEAVRDSICTVLETKGYQASEYRSSQDYLQRAGDDCVLLIDIAMGGIDGLDLTDLLRKGGIRTPVVLMADIANPWQSRRIAATERCCALHKPVDPAALLAAISTSVNDVPCKTAPK